MKRDTIVQTRLRRVDLAEAYLFLIDNGYYPRSMSEVVRLVFENSLAELVPVRKVSNTSEAITILRHFKSATNPKGRGFKALSENVMSEEMADNLSPLLPFPQKPVDPKLKVQMDFAEVETKRLMEIAPAPHGDMNLNQQYLIDMQDKIRQQQEKDREVQTPDLSGLAGQLVKEGE